MPFEVAGRSQLPLHHLSDRLPPAKVQNFHLQPMAPASIASARQHNTCQAIFANILAISAVSNALNV